MPNRRLSVPSGCVRRSRLRGIGCGAAAEVLEARALLTVYVVNTATDVTVNTNSNSDGLISLREAITAANNNAAFGDAPAGSSGTTDIIRFAPSMRGQTITIQGDDFLIAGNLKIDGVIDGIATNLPRINASNASRHFFIASGSIVEISGLMLYGGNGTDSGSGQQQGGAIQNFGSLTLRSMWIHGNTAGIGRGGGVSSLIGSINVIDSTISNNTAAEAAGLYLGVPGKIINSTVSGNEADQFAGGLWAQSGANLGITNSTFTGNRSDTLDESGQPGGGIGVSGNGVVVVENTLVAGNFQGNGTTPNDVFNSSSFTGSNNLIGDANSSGGLSDGQFDNIVGVNGSGTRDITTILDTTLQNNGGTWPTHALLQTSIAVNNGDSQLARDENGNFLDSDGRGAPFTRFGIGTANAGATVDIGAYELQPRFAVNTLADETDDPETFSLREALQAANAQDIGSNVGGSTDEILFSSTLDGGTITLNGTALQVMSGRTRIEGRGADLLTISANDQSSILGVASTGIVEISGLKLTEGRNGFAGGAIVNQGQLTLREMWLTGNQALIAGAVDNHRSGGVATLTLIDSLLENNRTSFSGGAIYNSGSLTVINTTLSGNESKTDGGAIYNNGVSIVTNSTITGNHAIFDGTASDGGGGISNDGGAITLNNTIVAGNFSGTQEAAHDIRGTVEMSSSNNLIGTANASGGLVDGTNGNIVGVKIHEVLDPVLRDNGGSTPTHALIPNSPAINRGNNALAVDENDDPLTSDQRGVGFDRVLTRVDMGAFEGFRDPMTSFTGFFNGNWWLATPDANGSYDTNVAASGPASTFQKVLTGDFNGDGHDDLAAWLLSGQWRVGLNDGNGNYNFTPWTTWSGPNIKEVHVGDFNNDGLDDIIGLFEISNRNRGRWWVGLSDGTRFTNRSWGDFGNFSGILDVAVGNFDGVKGDDLAIITATGNIFMAKTSNSSFQYLFSHNWSVNSGFNFFQPGDFNGDGREDLVAVFGSGASKSIFVAKSLGPAAGFASLKFSDLTATQSLDSFVVGDFNGDGKDDVAARLNTTKWWLGLAGVNVFNFTFGTTWSFASSGVNDIHIGSTNGDANSDILGRGSNGNWYSAESNGTGLTNRVIETWAPVNWQFVNGGDYSTPPAAPASKDELFTPQSSLQTNEPAQDLASRWSGPEETNQAIDSPGVNTLPAFGHEHPEEIDSEEYGVFGESSLLDLLFAS
ncbi:choice-of-anchor Q domain-containing protein [Rubinisphaera margarita]|uniref:choice-of-anchor Q domain-containing protein n=1 Tax=Rubinisphaera margarita TaxID=2909586 RepID=UPI001EE8E2A3|nr:choice-of-anchor Q domain-containing protein [Rubinisphaera margarita]MCG6154300.1 FG-GAP-like repeat-containing protein [Rubinisphaera margarita]